MKITLDEHPDGTKEFIELYKHKEQWTYKLLFYTADEQTFLYDDYGNTNINGKNEWGKDATQFFNTDNEAITAAIKNYTKKTYHDWTTPNIYNPNRIHYSNNGKERNIYQAYIKIYDPQKKYNIHNRYRTLESENKEQVKSYLINELPETTRTNLRYQITIHVKHILTSRNAKE